MIDHNVEGGTMASFDFLSLRFENIGENENDTYSVFVTRGEDGPEMVWYDSMGDPIIESGITDGEWDDVRKLAGECDIASWDGFSEMNVSEIAGFTLEIEDSEGNIIWAEGAGSFPDGFEAFEKGIRSIFEGYFE